MASVQHISSNSGLAGQVTRFARFLKIRGFKIFQSSVHDALLSLREIDFSRKEDFFVSLRVNFAKTDLEWVQFEDLFHEFWRQNGKDPDEEGDGRASEEQAEVRTSVGEPVPLIHPDQSARGDDEEQKEWLEGVAYSPISKLEKKDLSRFDRKDIRVAELALKEILESFKVHVSRRSRRSSRSKEMDFPRVMRKSLKTGGLPMELFYREKKKRLKRLVILADVSGSMDRYARFVMPFLLGLRGVGSTAEVFVFSTTLTCVTFMVRRLSVDKAIEGIAEAVPEWSGGTRIGYSFHQFNEGQGERLLNRRTVVVILSDGWDLGGKELLKREMAVLQRKAYCVIWLNPLAGDPRFDPLCQGMRIALPYVDYFLPANSLQSLKKVARLLSRVMIH